MTGVTRDAAMSSLRAQWAAQLCVPSVASRDREACSRRCACIATAMRTPSSAVREPKQNTAVQQLRMARVDTGCAAQVMSRHGCAPAEAVCARACSGARRRRRQHGGVMAGACGEQRTHVSGELVARRHGPAGPSEAFVSRVHGASEHGDFEARASGASGPAPRAAGSVGIRGR